MCMMSALKLDDARLASAILPVTTGRTAVHIIAEFDHTILSLRPMPSTDVNSMTMRVPI